MTDGIKISQFPFLTSFTGAETVPLVVEGENFQGNVVDLGNFLLQHLGVNRPPIATAQTDITNDTALQRTGNVLAGASDPDGDAFFIQTLSYHSTVEPFEDGSFQTDYGTFFLNGSNGAWTFTLGPGARALTTGDVAHEIFTFTIADGRGGLATQTLTITIIGTNSVPVVSSVDNFTPINVPVTGNLLDKNAFDYEPTPLTILHYVVDGIVGTIAPGSSQIISGVGTIVIAANGDYTFTPITDFFGPVPTVVYTVTDGANNVDAFLRLAVTPLIPGTRPIVVMTDTESCPITGGEDGNGGYLSIMLFRGGSSDGLGTNTKVFIGGQEVAAYRTLEPARVANKFPGLQHLRVQVGPLGNVLNMGEPYPIIVRVNGQDSNASFNFIPNPGRIIFVALDGDDSTAVPGDITKPYRHLQFDDPPFGPGRGSGGVYPILRAGDQVVIRGGNWSDRGFNSAWFRYRDPIQQGSVPNGTSGSGWIGFTAYPNEVVHYSTPEGFKGGFQGPGSAFEGSCGDYSYFSNLQIDIPGGGAQSDGAPINFQSISQEGRVVNNKFGPWVAGDSASLNAACVTGQGDRVIISCNDLGNIEGTSEQQNHGIYAGTSASRWEISFNWIHDCTGGSGIQGNDSEGGTGTKKTQFGTWEGFTGMSIHHNVIENTAKYGITFSDVGAYAGQLSFRVWNNLIIGTGLAALRLNTTTSITDGLYAFNTIYDCMRLNSGTGNAMLRNEGVQSSPNHTVRVYNNIFAFGPNTVPGTQWYYDYSGQGNGYDLKRNLYFANGQSPTAPSVYGDNLAVIGDPKFTNAGAGDFSLQASSPAANAGTKSLPSDLSVTDDITALASRQFGGAPEIGCYEIPQATPYLITAPIATGGPQVGVPTNANVGGWGNAPTSYSRQARIGGTLVGSPTTGTGTFTYTPVGDDANKSFEIVYTIGNGLGTDTVYILTVGTIAVGSGAPHNTALPVITGTAQAGGTLSGSDGTWSPSGSGFTYLWTRNGASTGVTTNTYALTGADVGANMAFVVTAQDSTNGNVSATSSAVGPVAAAPADPVLVQAKGVGLTANTANGITLDSAVANNNLLLFFDAGWDTAQYLWSFTDSQGHSSAASSFTFGDTNKWTDSDNPQAGFVFLRSTASAAYTLSVNPGSGSGGSGVLMEVSGCDPSTILDIPQNHNSGSTAAVSLTASAPTTKASDLILVGLAVGGTGITVTLPSGSPWAPVTNGAHDFGNNGVFVFFLKASGIITADFEATLSADARWVAQTFPIKGSG